MLGRYTHLFLFSSTFSLYSRRFAHRMTVSSRHLKQDAYSVFCMSRYNRFVKCILKESQTTEVQVMFIKPLDGKVVLVLLRGIN